MVNLLPLEPSQDIVPCKDHGCMPDQAVKISELDFLDQIQMLLAHFENNLDIPAFAFAVQANNYPSQGRLYAPQGEYLDFQQVSFYYGMKDFLGLILSENDNFLLIFPFSNKMPVPCKSIQ